MSPMDSRKLPAMPRPTLYNGLVACLLSVAIGYVIGSPNIPEAAIRGSPGGGCGPVEYTIQGGFPNCLQFSDLLWGFAIGSFCLGACIGSLSGATIQTRHGRKRTMVLSDALFIFGSLVISLSYQQAQFIIGRMVLGFACGLAGVVTPSYLNEISTVRSRGTMGTFHQLFLVVGLLISNLVGLIWTDPPGWRVTLAMNGVPSVLHLMLIRTVVESPKFLLARGHIEQGRRVLQKLRGSELDVDIEIEFSEMVRTASGGDPQMEPMTVVEAHREQLVQQPLDPQADLEGEKFNNNPLFVVERGDSAATIAVVSSTQTSAAGRAIPKTDFQDKERQSPCKDDTQEAYTIITLFRSECRSLALVGISIHFLQQASGINGLVYYSTSFLSTVFGNGESTSRLITLGVSCCNMVCTLLGVFLINRLPRRTLLLLSMGGISLSALLLIIGAYAKVGILVVVAVFLYIATFAIALGPIPWMLLSEMLPTYALDAGSAVATAVNWGTNFIIGLLFPTLSNALGNATFILFGGFTVLGFFYVLRFVPETRNRSVESVMASKGISMRNADKNCSSTAAAVAAAAIQH
ncbi:hypothetical protein EMPS_04900 [Entomortierella parvispora]|uniref:Major facilitator superfamily (MFS) profile domain-containing protein n=1 Tax=Entomortierella parvispora TaxID=205924 RepID=A0A9P3HA35_9FUNG|nr:hypothetical protein EMPS_04900 [Entomortierella parvispora]